MGKEWDEGPEPGTEGGFSSRPVRIGIAVFVLVVVGFVANNARLVAKLNRADDQVVAWKDRLAADKGEDGRWKRWEGKEAAELPERDPWGNPLRVRYVQYARNESLVVSSDGPDGREFSSDDLKAGAHNTDWTGIVREGVEEVAGATTRGAVRGAIDAVMERLAEKHRGAKPEKK